MTRILLVKTSSLGDVVHNLPVVSDVHRVMPDAIVDWVVEESFAAIPRMYPGVNHVIPVALRRWRRSLLRADTRAEMGRFVKALRATEYDAIVDTQGLLKSAIVAMAAKGRCYGLDWHSSREPLRPLYDSTFRVPWGQHAVVRNRSLAAQALGYAMPATVDFGITAPQRSFEWLSQGRYAVLLHATSADAKLWPEHQWQELSKYLFLNDIFSVLPWGSQAEHERGSRLAAAMPHSVVAPALALDELAALMARAQVVVGVDTGLTHLAGALNVPTVGVYCATDPAATGVYTSARAINVGDIGAPPSVQDVVAAIEQLGVT